MVIKRDDTNIELTPMEVYGAYKEFSYEMRIADVEAYIEKYTSILAEEIYDKYSPDVIDRLAEIMDKAYECTTEERQDAVFESFSYLLDDYGLDIENFEEVID